MNGGGDIAVDQAESVITVDGVGLIRESEAVQGTVQPVSRSVTGKHPAGTIAAMCRRRESDNQQTGIRRTEAGNRPAPVFLIAEPSHFYARDFFAVDG